jgi:hypothetical protein
MNTQEHVLYASFTLQVQRSMYKDASKQAYRMPCPKKYRDLCVLAQSV